ncbi:FAD-dependent oxidoreductase [Myxococcota bacterium]|jgi:thioredoxin reductase (NADPH)|nr:FAD-dependent oxidoreductase [Myxococcota bacterium]MBU1411234.1 FAD-dependent oxidoreductase [Myxococcota bacterium]MBU1509609.1 FAD-dependent oxidoreductase [Myxococcota bacterium]PKN23749.1 MAG: pyridine nucleotide-disulfide oxidoreductase [Deltaproteobacteria bacterium HGW-Deltaproteobacteria-22]
METHPYDAIVLGGGPAGLTAAIYLARARLSTLVLDTGTPGGQMNLSHEVANYPGVLVTSGAELGRIMRAQAESFGARVISQVDLLGLDLRSELKLVEVEDEGVFSAPVVILAPGGSPRTLGLDSERRFMGRGISYCATCDGDFFAGQDIAVIGGGNSALEEAVSLTKYASSVTILHEFDHFQAHPWAVEQARANPKIRFLMEQMVTDFEGDERLAAVTSIHKLTGKTVRVPVTGTFIFIGYVPRTVFLSGQVELSDRGEILTDERMRTNLPGVYAAGDARAKPYRQITTAVSDGTIAAIHAAEVVENWKKKAK